MSTTKAEILQHEKAGPWRALMDVAGEVVKHAEAAAGGSSMQPLLGGGTRLMLSLHHRISDDIDLFIRDPQWIGYLTPRLNDHTEAMVDSYEENAVSLKLRLPKGEIDFIVAMSLLNLSVEHSSGVAFSLEPVAEVLAKKLFYRGSLLTPRDLFDWWAIAKEAPDVLPRRNMAELLKDRWDGIEATLKIMRHSPGAHRLWTGLRAPEKPDIASAVDFAVAEIAAYRQISA